MPSWKTVSFASMTALDSVRPWTLWTLATGFQWQLRFFHKLTPLSQKNCFVNGFNPTDSELDELIFTASNFALTVWGVTWLLFVVLHLMGIMFVIVPIAPFTNPLDGSVFFESTTRIRNLYWIWKPSTFLHILRKKVIFSFIWLNFVLVKENVLFWTICWRSCSRFFTVVFIACWSGWEYS